MNDFDTRTFTPKSDPPTTSFSLAYEEIKVSYRLAPVLIKSWSTSGDAD